MTKLNALFSALLVSMFAVAASCSSEEDAPAPEPSKTAAPTPEKPAATGADYSNLDNWLCHPGKTTDACDAEISVAMVEPNAVSVAPLEAAALPAYDCFYIYPTISLDPTPNSDLEPGVYEELRVVAQQLAPYKDKCRLYAPIYRQLTLGELRSFMATGELKGDLLTRYLDVKNAWERYVAQDNEGRGVVLIGHSQGAAMVQELLAKHINHSADMDLIVSAVAIGYSTPIGPDGGAFNMGLPFCTSADQAGCMIAWSSFRADAPPPENSIFGQALPIGARIACTNPAKLLGADDGAISPLLPAQPLGSTAPVAYFDGAPVEAEFAALPGMLTAACETNETHDWLAISVHGDPGDKRLDDIPGDVMTDGAADPFWGLHMVDFNIAMGDLKTIFDRQSAAWTARFIEE